MMRRAAIVALGVALSLAIAGGTALAIGSATVRIEGSQYSPQVATVVVGGPVTWTNKDPGGHTATAPGVFDTGVLLQFQSKTIVMTKVGKWEYHCLLHPSMTGFIEVVAVQTTKPPTPKPATPTPKPPTPRPATPAPTVAPTPSPTEAPTPTPAPTVAVSEPAATPLTVAAASSTERPGGTGGGLATVAAATIPDGPGSTLTMAAGVLVAALTGFGLFLARKPQ